MATRPAPATISSPDSAPPTRSTSSPISSRSTAAPRPRRPSTGPATRATATGMTPATGPGWIPPWHNVPESALPGPDDNVVIDVAGAVVNHAITSYDTIRSLTVTARGVTLNLDSGTLDLSGGGSLGTFQAGQARRPRQPDGGRAQERPRVFGHDHHGPPYRDRHRGRGRAQRHAPGAGQLDPGAGRQLDQQRDHHGRDWLDSHPGRLLERGCE